MNNNVGRTSLLRLTCSTCKQSALNIYGTRIRWFLAYTRSYKPCIRVSDKFQLK